MNLSYDLLYKYEFFSKGIKVMFSDIYSFIRVLLEEISKDTKTDRIAFLIDTGEGFFLKLKIGKDLPRIDEIYPLEREIDVSLLVNRKVIEDPKEGIGFDYYIPICDKGLLIGVICLDDTNNKRMYSVQEKHIISILSGLLNDIIISRNRRHELVYVDSLTSVSSRRVLSDNPEILFQGKQTVCMLDLDHFKAINDTYGHQAGDEVLRRFGLFLKANVRAEDYVIRYGGEEFLLIMGASLDDAQKRLHQVMEGFSHETFIIEGDEETVLQEVTFSAGICEVPALLDHVKIKEIIAFADTRLRVAKARGRKTIFA